MVCATVFLVEHARNVREQKQREQEQPEPGKSYYRLNRLNQQTFTKAVNIVMDLVQTEGADIEVTYNGTTLFNGYMDRDDKGRNKPHFWYNKKVLDQNDIIYE